MTETLIGDREGLGLAMQNWHSSQADPIYAVGSFYFAGKVYPEREIVQNAVEAFERMHDQYTRMLRGEVVWVERCGARVSLQAFAGYTPEDLESHISEIGEILDALNEQIREDYN